jgi:LPXTG-motif cell wall-anchored protein
MKTKATIAWNKLLSVVLTALLVLAFSPSAVFAEEVEPPAATADSETTVEKTEPNPDASLPLPDTPESEPDASLPVVDASDSDPDVTLPVLNALEPDSDPDASFSPLEATESEPDPESTFTPLAAPNPKAEVPTVSVTVGNSATFTAGDIAEGGDAPLSIKEITAGSIGIEIATAGLIIDPVRVQITGVAVGTTSVTVVVSDGISPNINVVVPIVVTAAGGPTPIEGTLPNGKVGVPYVGVAADFDRAWRAELQPFNSDLPEGLSLAADTDGYGILTGTPLKAGTYEFTIQQVKGPTLVNEWIYTLTIAPRDTVVLQGGAIGNQFSVDALITVPISGIDDVQLTGSLPNGLTPDSQITNSLTEHEISVTISGYPTKAGTYTFELQLYEGVSPAGDPYTYSITIVEPDHYFENGVNTYTRGSGLSLVHITEKDLATHDDTVFVTHAGDATVDPADQITKLTHYTAESGSTRVILSPAYLDTLATGSHWLTVSFNDEGAPIQDLFIVADAPTSTNLPQTGDDLSLLVLMGALFSSGLAILSMRSWRRRRQSKHF